MSGYDSWVDEKSEDSTHVATQSVLPILEDINGTSFEVGHE